MRVKGFTYVGVYICVQVHMYMHMGSYLWGCTCMYIGTWTHVCVCVKARIWQRGLIDCSLSYVLRQGFQLSPGSTDSASLASQRALGISCLCLSDAGITGGLSCLPGNYGRWGLDSHACTMNTIHRAISPVSKISKSLPPPSSICMCVYNMCMQ